MTLRLELHGQWGHYAFLVIPSTRVSSGYIYRCVTQPNAAPDYISDDLSQAKYDQLVAQYGAGNVTVWLASPAELLLSDCKAAQVVRW